MPLSFDTNKKIDNPEFDRLTENRLQVDEGADWRRRRVAEHTRSTPDSCSATTISALGTELTRSALLAGLLAVEFAAAAAKSDESLFHGLQGGRKVTGILLMAMALVASSMACALLATLPPTKGCRNTVLARFFILFIVMSAVEILCLFILVGMSCNESNGEDVWACSRAPTILALGVPIQVPTLGGRIIVFMAAWSTQLDERGLDSNDADQVDKRYDPESLMENGSPKQGGTGLRHRGFNRHEDDDECAASERSADTGLKKHAALENIKTGDEHRAVAHYDLHAQIEDTRMLSVSLGNEVNRLTAMLDAQVSHRKILEKRIAIAEQRNVHSGDFERIRNDLHGRMDGHADSHRQQMDQFKQQLTEFSGLAQAVGLSKAEAGSKKFQEQLANAIATPEKQLGDAKKFALSLLSQASEMASILCALDRTEKDSKDIRRLRAKYQSATHLRELIIAAIDGRVREVLDPSARHGKELVTRALNQGGGNSVDIPAARDAFQPGTNMQQSPSLFQNLAFQHLPQSLHHSGLQSGDRVERNLFKDHAMPPRTRSLDNHDRRFGAHDFSPFPHQHNSHFYQSPPRIMPPPPMMTPSPMRTSPFTSPPAYGQGMMGGSQFHMVHAPFHSPQMRQ